jgi:LysM repeat protein
MVSELKKDDVKEKPQVNPEAAEHHDEPNKFQKDAHGPEALAQHRMIRAGVSKEVSLPPVDLVSSIKNDGSAQTYHVKRGDMLSQIARDHLPPGASTKEVYKHVAEIAKANGITDPDKIKAGIDLKLPEKKAAEKPEAPRDGANDSKPGDRIPVPGKDAQPVPVPGKDAQPVPVSGQDAKPGDKIPLPGKDAQPLPLPGKDAQAIPDPGQEFQPVHNVDSSIGKPVDQASMAKAAEAVEKALGPEIDPSAQAMAMG